MTKMVTTAALSMTPSAIKARERRARIKALPMALRVAVDAGDLKLADAEAQVALQAEAEAAEAAAEAEMVALNEAEAAEVAEAEAFELTPEIEHVQPGRQRPWWRRRTVGRVSKAELIEAVRKVALEQYESGRGWDYVVEAYSDEDILRAIGNARSVRGAIWRVGNEVLVKARVAQDIQATAF